MSVRYVVGLDPSTTAFGVACGGERDGSPRAFTWKLGGAEDHVFDRTLSVAFGSAYELFLACKATDAFIEAPIIVSDRSAHTMMALVQLAGAVRAAAARAGVRTHMVASSTVRKFFCGHGRPENPKCAVQERCKLLGWPVSDDNSADAAATWAYGMAKVCPRWAPKSTVLFGRPEVRT